MYRDSKISIDGKELTEAQCRAVASAVEGYYTQLMKSENEIHSSGKGINNDLKASISEVRALLNDLHEFDAQNR